MAKALGERTKMMLHPTGMWEVIRMTKRKVMESSFGHLATFIRETIETMRERVTERCTLQIRQCTRAIGKEVFRLETLL